MSTFGRIFPFSRVEQYIVELTDAWFTDYLDEVARQEGMDPTSFDPLKSIVTANDFDLWLDEHIPALIVMYTGLNDRPTRRGDGKWDARALFGAGVIVSSPLRSTTRLAMHVYSAAFKAMVLQHRSLGHPNDIGGVTWADERPAPLRADQELTKGAMNMYFYVDVKEVVDERGKPPGPNPSGDRTEEPGDPPVVQPDPADPSRPIGGIEIRPNMETP